MTKILTPQQPAPVLEIARALLPPGLEVVVVRPHPARVLRCGRRRRVLPGLAAPRDRQRVLPRRAPAEAGAADQRRLRHRVDLEAARKAKVLPNVTLTPHSAGPTWDNWAKAYRNGFDNIQRVEAGRAPFWVVPELRTST